LLLGYSFGAHIAVEIARLLYARGHTVQLILVDSSVRDADHEKFRSPEMAASVVQSFKMDTSGGNSSDETQEFMQNLDQEITRNLRLLVAHRMRYFPHKATFLRADLNSGSGVDDNSNGYRELVKDLNVQHVCGDHSEIFSMHNIAKNSVKIAQAFTAP
jgi:thioesterase domain-containing protein